MSIEVRSTCPGSLHDLYRPYPHSGGYGEKTPESPDHTSIQERLKKAQEAAQPNHPQKQLLIFTGNPKEDMPKGLPFRLTDHLELVNWTFREDKRGASPENTLPILNRLNIESKDWLYLTKNFESPFKGMVGTVSKLKEVCKNSAMNKRQEY